MCATSAPPVRAHPYLVPPAFSEASTDDAIRVAVVA